MPTNRLIHEKSPYLLQHAHNPVEWYAWGEEAFEKARREQKPIFLSVGYSTCHWCHVMERESFESEPIAAILNEHFVPVKVDREERPDVDRVYMLFVQLTTGGGGWPMSVWLTPDLKPFYGGTYFPPDNRYGRPGFPALLNFLAEAWKNDRAKILETSNNALGGIQRYLDRKAETAPAEHKQAFDSAFQQLRRTFDSELGGFGSAPKFPRPSLLNFLFRYYERYASQEARDMALFTLEEMSLGGMNDQLGGGFHRYSVDEYWFVPHFEKMLYDQAQLAIAYVEAFQITGDEGYANSARSILDYVLRDMTLAEGGFYSAEDADSVIDPAHPHEKGEGAFYIWSDQEIESALPAPQRDWFRYYYGVEPNGNVEQDPHQEFTGKNILFVAHSIEETAQHFNIEASQLTEGLEQSRQRLLEIRSTRPRPHLDDKLLTAWNGLMISAFAKAAQALDEKRYRQAAQAASQFLKQRLFDASTGRVLRRFRDGEAAIPGFLDDYAFWIQALIDLYETDFDLEHLKLALQLSATQDELFLDASSGAYFSSADTDKSLVLRIRDDYDGAEPSGNSIALSNLVRLAHLTGREEFRQRAEKLVQAFATPIAEQPTSIPQFLVGVMLLEGPIQEVVLASDGQTPEFQALLRTLQRRFLPRHISIAMLDRNARDFFAAGLPNVKDMTPVNGKASAYVCQNFTCQLPVSTEEELAKLLR